MRIVSILILFLIVQTGVHAQVLEFDQLEMRYDQQQYKSVHKQAKRLMANPEYDYSFVPRYYLALSSLQLAQNKRWLRRNKHTIEDAEKIFREIYQTIEGQKLLKAHLYEISALKSDMNQWIYALEQSGDHATSAQVQNFVNTLFKNVPYVETMRQDHIAVEEPIVETKDDVSAKDISSLSTREKILEESYGLIGIPYRLGGMNTTGFDCSGFVYYAFDKGSNMKLDRTAAAQYKSSKKIKAKNVKPGDLVFFNTGSGVSHVGIVYSTKNNSIQMIHASTSIGVSIVDIYESSYWKSRIVGFGTPFND